MNPFRKTMHEGDEDDLSLALLLRQIDESADSGRVNENLDLQDLDDNQLDQLAQAKACIDLLRQFRATQNESTFKPDAETVPGKDLDAEPASARSAQRTVGRYTIKQLIGEGGFAEVYLAHDPALNRDVALKIPRPNVVASGAAKARFIRESQSAAMLSHPNIVPVFDSGSDGQTMFISFGYCPGTTLARWAGEQPVSPITAARIVARLAEAVGHAHDRGIVHRDLKPGNILIEDDGDAEIEQRVRIADFGLARNTLQQQQTLTMTGVMVGTPAYMSPEQVRCEPQIGSASDIYSLGVILYELLTGKQPHTKDHFVSTLRAIVETEPASPRSINRRIPFDLEAICLKCLNKHPADRYASAFDLYEDLQQWLNGKPIKARKASCPKIFAQWCRRNPWIAASLAVAFLSLAMGTGIATAKWLDAEQEKNRAVAATNQAHRESKRAGDLLATFADTYRQINMEDGGSDLTASQILRLTHNQVKLQLRDDPQAQAEMYQLLADCFEGLGKYTDALQCQIDENRITESGDDFLKIVASRQSLMSLYRRAGRHDESLAIQEQTVRRCERVLGSDDPVTIKEKAHLGIGLALTGQTSEAIELERQLLDHLESKPNSDLDLIVYVANRLAMALNLGKEERQVVDLFQRRMASFEAALVNPEQLSLLADAKRYYSRALNAAGQRLQAVQLQEEAVELRKQIGATKGIISGKRNLASCLLAAKQYENAAQVMQEVVDLTLEEYGENHPESIDAQASLAVYLRDVYGFDTAIALQKNAIETSSRVLGEAHAQTIGVMLALGKSYRLDGQYELALEIVEDAVSRLNLPADSRSHNADVVHRELARSYAAAGRVSESIQHFEKLIALRERKYGAGNNQVQVSRIELIMQQIRAGFYDDAEALARTALGHLRDEHGGTFQEYNITQWLSYALERQGKYESAQALARQAKASGVINARTTAILNSILGTCLAQQGKTRRAEKLLLGSFNVLESTWMDMQPQNYRSATVRPQTRFVVQHAAERVLDYYRQTGRQSEMESWQEKLNQVNQMVPPLRN